MFQLTNEIRELNRPVADYRTHVTENVTQQKWVDDQTTEGQPLSFEWRDVPKVEVSNTR